MRRPSLYEQQLRMRTVAQAYGLYRRAILHPAAPPDQILETTRAFYAGVQWALTRVIHETEDEESAARLLKQLLEECSAFAKSQVAGQGGGG